MAKSILTSIFLYFFSNQILMFELKPYQTSYTAKPSGTVIESLEKVSETSWKMTSIGKHPLFKIKQESIFRLVKGNVVLESGFRKLDVLGGLRKDHQSYKVEKKDDKRIVSFSFGKKEGSFEILNDFYDNLTLQIQAKLNFLEKDVIEIDYLNKGGIKKKIFFKKESEIIYKSKPTEVYEFTEQRKDKKSFSFYIKRNSKNETVRVSQGGPGFNINWELD